MRIGLLTHQWPGARMGGIGSAVAQTAGALASSGHDVHAFTLALPEDVRAELPSGFTVHEMPDLAARVQRGMISGELSAVAQSGGDGVYRLAIASLLCDEVKRFHRERRFDVVEAPEVEALGLPLLLDPAFDVPVVAQLHCCTALARKFNGTAGDDEAKLIEALEFAGIHLADGVCAPTRAVVEATRELCAIDRDVAIIPHPFGCSSEFTPPPDDGPILFVGRLERLKGVEDLTRALNLFLPKNRRATFRFVGPDTCTGPSGTSMQQWMLSELDGSIRSRVSFAGQLSPGKTSAEWRAARFGVMPSVWENFSIALCEGLGAGRSVIVADGTGSSELLGDAGITVAQKSPEQLASAIENLWTDREMLHRLSRKAHDRINVFSPAKLAEARTDFYRRVMESSDRVRGKRERLLSLPAECAAAVLPALARVTASLCGLENPWQTPGRRLLKVMNHLKAKSGLPAEVMLYGAGKHTARLLAERYIWESKKHRVVGIIDDHPRFAQSPVYLDLPVQSLNCAASRVLSGKVVPPVVLSTDTYEDQFWARSAPLREAGVPVFRLYSSHG